MGILKSLNIENLYRVMSLLKTLSRPECFASVCFCLDSVAEESKDLGHLVAAN